LDVNFKEFQYKNPFCHGSKRGFRSIYHPKQSLCWLEHLASAGCCDVNEPDLSATLDNYLVNMFSIEDLAYFC
jgi:hypothetical protein